MQLTTDARGWLDATVRRILARHLPKRRRLQVAAAVVLYIERVITYLYFAPTVLGWQDTTPAQTTPALLDEVSRWMRLDLARSPVDWLLLAVLMVALIACPRIRTSTHPAAAWTGGVEATAVAPAAVEGR